jgi:hypothetical protein
MCGRYRGRSGGGRFTRHRRGWRCGDRDNGRNGHAAGLDQLADVRHALITLWFGVKHRGGDHLGLGGGKLVHHVGHDFARPRPATDVVQAGLVDRDYGDLVRGRARCGCHTHVIGLALQALQQIAIPQNQHNDADHNTEEPVTLPEVRLLHRSLPCVRALIKTGQ